MSKPSDIVMMDALALSRAIQAKQVSCVEVMNAYLDHIDALNPKVNAIVSLQDRGDLVAQAKARDERACPRRSLRLDARLAPGDQGPDRDQGHPHHAGLAHLQGFRAQPPTRFIVERVKRAGAIIIGKTNTPEFGLGSNTYNDVFGRTLERLRPVEDRGRIERRRRRRRRAAHAAGRRRQSDHGGSLRNPAAYNNVFGFRPSFGRVPAQCARRLLRHHGDAGSDGAQRTRPRRAAVGAGRLRSARAAVEPSRIRRNSQDRSSATSRARASPGPAISAAICRSSRASSISARRR